MRSTTETDGIELRDERQEEPLVQNQDGGKKVIMSQNKIFYKEIIISTLFWGTANFFYGILTSHDFSTSCLQKIDSLGTYFHAWAKDSMRCGLQETKNVSIYNLIHLALRSLNFFALSWLTTIAAYYARIANVNYGVISSCTCVSAPLNCILCYFVFKERLTPTLIAGTVVILIGIVWVSMTKGQDQSMSSVEDGTIDEESKSFYRIISVGIAVFVGFLGAMRVFQAKYINKSKGYSPMDFSIDGGLLCGIVLGVCAITNMIIGNETYTLYNFTVCTIANFLLMLTSLISLIASVKGLAGPSSAILNTNAIVQQVLNAAVLNMIPTIFQVFGSLIAISGVAIMMLFK